MRCTNCQRFGHSRSNCGDKTRCKDCGKEHAPEEQCEERRCINCRGDHPADSSECRAFTRLKEASKRAIEERSRPPRPSREGAQRSYSDAVRGGEASRGNDTASRSDGATRRVDPEVEILKGQVAALQTEVKSLKTELGRLKALERSVDMLQRTVDSNHEEIKRSLARMAAGRISHPSTSDESLGEEEETGEEMEEDFSAPSGSQAADKTTRPPSGTVRKTPEELSRSQANKQSSILERRDYTNKSSNGSTKKKRVKSPAKKK